MEYVGLTKSLNKIVVKATALVDMANDKLAQYNESVFDRHSDEVEIGYAIGYHEALYEILVQIANYTAELDRKLDEVLDELDEE